MRPFFTSNSEAAKKYRDDLFLMGPFYHRIFPYEKFIMLDADLKFRIDIAELYDMFEDFSNNQVMGVGVDLAPHYRIAFREYRKKNPDTSVGEPGRFQVRNLFRPLLKYYSQTVTMIKLSFTYSASYE